MSRHNEIKAALEFLVNYEDYRKLRRDVEQLASITSGVFSGDMGALNVLVDIAREKGVAKLGRVWELVESKRTQLAPRKRVYQAGYMRARRAREAKALQVKEIVARRRLPTEERRAFRKAIHLEWSSQRDDILEPFAGSGNDKNELVSEFWDDIDATLDKALAGDDSAARRVLGDLYE